MTGSGVQDVLDGRRSASAVDKVEFLVARCAGRDVLDVGCVQHSWEQADRNPRWLHRLIAEQARSCVGVDYLDEDVGKLVELGYDIVCQDILVEDPPGQFDVVVMGDLIEHVEDPVSALGYAARALRPGGEVVVTTPNATYLGQLLTILISGRPTINAEHVTIYDPFTFANLVSRTDLVVTEYHWIPQSWTPQPPGSSRRLNRLMLPVLRRAVGAAIRWRPYLSSDFIAVLAMRGGEASSPSQRAAAVFALRNGW